MKLAETLTPPEIELTKLDSGVDEDLLHDMVSSGARLCLHGNDINELIKLLAHGKMYRALYSDRPGYQRQLDKVQEDYFCVMRCFYRTHDRLMYAEVALGITIHADDRARPIQLSAKKHLKFKGKECYVMVTTGPPMTSQDINLINVIDKSLTLDPI